MMKLDLENNTQHCQSATAWNVWKYAIPHPSLSTPPPSQDQQSFIYNGYCKCYKNHVPLLLQKKNLFRFHYEWIRQAEMISIREIIVLPLIPTPSLWHASPLYMWTENTFIEFICILCLRKTVISNEKFALPNEAKCE